ncbi:MAG TPA: imidazole glycerol phosphate synthase subunit HisF [Elusimicrobiota bacterium]|nr:imidazole glycerol phosphate synthase subunit HisF [Elusimicrobiota bacterium]
MLTKRVVACLDVKDGVVVKGVKFRGHEPMGDPVELALRYRAQGVDELVFYDIAASAEGRRVPRAWVEKTAAALDIPFCVAGGIRSVADAEELLNAGADKISVNSPALERPALISELARRFGAQCVVVGVDSRRDEGEWRVFQYTGLETKTVSSKRRMLDWLREAQDRGAGEVVLNCMDADGTGAGYDVEQLAAARKVLQVPLVASGGAKSAADFVRVFKIAGVDAALAAGAFHRGELEIGALKRELRSSGIEVRP